MSDDLAALARAVLDSNRYMTLATASADGEPWASPVWMAPDDALRSFYWVSLPEARHSRNLAARPELAMVIFDSTVAPMQGKAVYLSALGGEVGDDEVAAGLEVYSRRSVVQGIGEWGVERVTGEAPHRLYRAVVREASVLVPGDHPLHEGRRGDFRAVVSL